MSPTFAEWHRRFIAVDKGLIVGVVISAACINKLFIYSSS